MAGIRRANVPAKTNTEGEYRVLLTSQPDDAYTLQFLLEADKKAETLRIKIGGHSLTFRTSGDLMADTRLIDRLLKNMDA